MYCYVAIGLARHADKVPEWEELAAVAAAVQNMQLQAAALGGVACYWSSWQEAARGRAACLFQECCAQCGR